MKYQTTAVKPWRLGTHVTNCQKGVVIKGPGEGGGCQTELVPGNGCTWVGAIDKKGRGGGARDRPPKVVRNKTLQLKKGIKTRGKWSVIFTQSVLVSNKILVPSTPQEGERT